MTTLQALGALTRSAVGAGRRRAGRAYRAASSRVTTWRTNTGDLERTSAEQRAMHEPASPYPSSFDLDALRANHPDLAGFDDTALIAHFRRTGHTEGRRAFRIGDRDAFVALVGADARALEIGPFQMPMLSGPNVRYFDVLDRDGLVDRATSLGLDTARIPEQIHVVSPIGDLGVVTERFDAVLSSHCIEHQPDLVRHLRQVADLLAEGGRYFVLVPDQRYCFDHFLPPSPTAAVVEAHLEARTRHTKRAVIEHRAHTAHNDAGRHWAGDHGDPGENRTARLRAAIDELDHAGDAYIDVHAWQFTPDSFATVLADLADLGLNPFDLERLYPTTSNHFEFWAILRKR
ncbi:MAG: class I SAM-dependent methyltransferase [Actinobacteria bacterium]|nr:class I SAM-dependent methyltransferase [Actinomycetota bacterium]